MKRNLVLRTSHRIGENSTFLQFRLAQTGIVLTFPDLPVITGQSLLKCSSIRTFGSWPGRIATGVLQNGPSKSLVSWRLTDNRVERHTIWSYSVMLALVILSTFMGGHHKMLLAEGFFAMLAFEWQEVHQETWWVWALFPNSKELWIAGRHELVRWVGNVELKWTSERGIK